MTNNGIVSIHGKEYMTVARRVELAHADNIESIATEVLQHSPVVVVKAEVVVKGKTFSGISAANPMKSIEKSNPYEVAETSAVGRALGFAGYGIIEGIASADEMTKADEQASDARDDEPPPPTDEATKLQEQEVECEVCGKPAVERRGVSKAGKNYHGIFCSTKIDTHTRWLWN